jgi:hypothetical protein
MRKRKKSAAVNRNTKRLQKDSLPPKLYWHRACNLLYLMLL